MNVLESILVEEAIRDGKANQAIEKVRTQIVKINGHQMKARRSDESDSDDPGTWSNPDGGYDIVDRETVTGEFHEGVKVHNPSTFRLEPAADGSTDSPFA